jgi:excinuclease ABC subunit A
MENIVVQGARTHNLKNIDLTIPRDKLVVITGISGSGKSSLAFDTLYAEGQRRYVESLSTYARQFLSMMDKPDMDQVSGLSPAISIEQKSTSHNPRSTVGTITEIYDYLRLLFARVGDPYCPDHHKKLEAQTVSQMVDQVLALPEGSSIMLLAPIIRDRKGEHVHVFNELKTAGFIRARVDGIVTELDYPPELEKNKKHTIEAVIDRFKVRPGIEQRLAESFETALTIANGIAVASSMDDSNSDDIIFSSLFACPECGHSIPELEPRLFSFNNPAGACDNCDGLGVKQYFDEKRVIVDDNLTIGEGAIRRWDRRNSYYFQLLNSLGEHYDFDMDTPWKKLPKKIQEVIMHGSGTEKITFTFVNERGDNFQRSHKFEGILPNMERRFRETESQAVREDFAKYLSTQNCPDCEGTRLRKDARHVFIDKLTLPEITTMTIAGAGDYFDGLKFKGKKKDIAEKILKEIQDRLRFLIDVGLNYLTLNRSAETLSGGEAQRIRLASQIGAGLVGVMYILDEPSIGLHQRDNDRLLKTLRHLRDLGNTVIVVEHDEEAIASADHIIDIGPGAGVHGGEVVAQGTLAQITKSTKSLTGKYLSGKESIEIPAQRTTNDPDKQLVLSGASGNNLKGVTLNIPIGLFTCITGVSGSGKSTLVNNTLYPLAATILNKASTLDPAPYDRLEGIEQLDKVVDIDQSPIGRTPRSNPATYTGIFTPVRELFAATQEARSRGYKPGRVFF